MCMYVYIVHARVFAVFILFIRIVVSFSTESRRIGDGGGRKGKNIAMFLRSDGIEKMMRRQVGPRRRILLPRMEVGTV